MRHYPVTPRCRNERTCRTAKDHQIAFNTMIISVNLHLSWRAMTALTEFPVTIAWALVSLMIEGKAMDLNAVSFYQGGIV